MTLCSECNIVDLGVTRIVKDGEEYILCPNCGAEDSVTEVDADLWAEDLIAADADLSNDLEEWDE